MESGFGCGIISFQCHFIIFFNVKYIYFINLCFLIALKERSYFALVEIYFHLISMRAVCYGGREEYRHNINVYISSTATLSVLVVTVLRGDCTAYAGCVYVNITG